MSGRVMVTAAAVLLVLGSGCAKTPATMATSSPAPSSGSSSTGPRPVTPAASRSGLTSGPTTTQATARPRVTDFAPSPDLRDIYFDFDKYEIRADAAKTLDANAAWLRSRTSSVLLVEGHCDERGTNEYNLALGDRRAKATMNYLVSRGVDARRITVVSYGEDRPQCQEHNEACWAKNRRARFLVKAE